jgi:hypothetical protein
MWKHIKTRLVAEVERTNEENGKLTKPWQVGTRKHRHGNKSIADGAVGGGCGFEEGLSKP